MHGWSERSEHMGGGRGVNVWVEGEEYGWRERSMGIVGKHMLRHDLLGSQ